jgi:hypothetical protein
MSPPSLGLKNMPSKNPLLATYFLLVSYLARSSTLKIAATCSSEMLVDFQWTTWQYIPEDRTLYNHCFENLKSYVLLFTFTFEKSA